MKKYINPDIKIDKFSVSDIITQSGMVYNASELSGENKEIYDAYSMNSDVKSTNVSLFSW